MSIFDGNLERLNIPMRVMNEGVFWNDIRHQKGYVLQQHSIVSDHWRILDSEDRRIAWGTETQMRIRFQELCEPHRGLKRGDVIGVHRFFGCYDHYGIYSSGDAVYHYAPMDNEFGSKACVHVTTLKNFLGDSGECFVLVIPESPEYHLYSPAETIRRAKSRLGEREYNLFLNNCEHFAFWCKTGIKESRQVEGLIRSSRRRAISFMLSPMF